MPTPSRDAATTPEPDRILDGYSEWLNEKLFEGKGEEDTLLWLGDNNWLIASNLDPGDLFVISIRRAKIVKPGDPDA